MSVPESSFAELLSQYEQERTAARDAAEALPGTVISITGDQIFVDIGRKREGVIDAAQLRDAKGELKVSPGDAVQVTVTGRGPDGCYALSTVRVHTPKDWSSLEQAFADKAIIAGVVEEVIKGGLKVDVGARAFLPASRSGARDAAELEKLVGQQIRCRILQLDVPNEDVVVDRRSVLEEEENQIRQVRFSALQEGAIVRGTVRSVTDFGAFVDLGGFDGLLHVTDMAWTRVAKPADAVSVGDSIEVKILKIDPQAHKLSLGLKQLQPDPWDLAVEKFKAGDRVRGRITRVADFGAFVELEPGVEGLIHVSELSWSKKSRRAADIVSAGELVEVVILGVNSAERRISLGLRQALGDPWLEAGKKYPPGTVIEKPVTTLANFGAFVEIEEGLEGMIHIADITAEKRLNHPNEMLAVGKTVRAVVLGLDAERRRIKLGMKQLEPTDIDEYIREHKPGDTVSGRLVDVGSSTARVELGDGVFARCYLEKAAAAAEAPRKEPGKADLTSLTAMLSDRWKKGAAASTTPELPKAGQIRQFRIRALDPERKTIDVELAG